jgi:hypothetical protein
VKKKRAKILFLKKFEKFLEKNLLIFSKAIFPIFVDLTQFDPIRQIKN